jgi:hypothetical protein
VRRDDSAAQRQRTPQEDERHPHGGHDEHRCAAPLITDPTAASSATTTLVLGALARARPGGHGAPVPVTVPVRSSRTATA